MQIGAEEQKRGKGFTLIELLVIIAVISIISTIGMVVLNSTRAKARDARRLADMHQINTALRTYFLTQGEWPPVGEGGHDDLPDSCPEGGDWDRSNRDGDGDGDPFIEFLRTSQYFKNGTPVDPLNRGSACFTDGRDYTYLFYKKPPGYMGCKDTGEYFYLLGIPDMETVEGTHPQSPGCPCASWDSYFEWITCWPRQAPE